MFGLYQQQKHYQKSGITPSFLKEAVLITEQFCNCYMLLFN